jgi:alkane 1-monooxygenase
MRSAGIVLRYLPHGFAVGMVTTAFVGGAQAFGVVGWLFLIAPLVECILGEEPSSQRLPSPAERIAFQLSPWLWLPLQAAVVVAGIVSARDSPNLVAAAWVAIPIGMVSGMFGMAAAHELMHRGGYRARGAAAMLLAACAYSHFCVEHVRGHHRRVGTPADGATARLGEGIYRFLPRTLKAGLASAWRLEARRLTQSGRRAIDPRNRVIAGGVLSMVFGAAAVLAAGFAGAVFFLTQAAVSITILEVMNYIQHYGLVRRETMPGLPEPIDAVHAWDCRFRLTNLLLLDLGLHSDHHLRPAHTANELEARLDAPRLPAGYFTLFALALMPPLWMQIMDPRVQLLRMRIDRGLLHRRKLPNGREGFHAKQD